ncbi:MAG: hypothetical protein KUG79_15940, partial [Pseudomonadales bacterium]|nr:hypothetical protein [Pseudomonadales bacterium]
AKQDINTIQANRRAAMLADALWLKRARNALGSLSTFMQHLKQPIAWRANREDHCTGHFFEGRFYSGALLSEQAVLATMAYVDLNPVRAKICAAIENYAHTSVYRRLQHLKKNPAQLHALMAPLVSGLTSPIHLPKRKPLPTSLGDYIDQLHWMSPFKPDQLTNKQLIWFSKIASIKKRQHAYGLKKELEQWAARFGWRRAGDALD